MLPLPSTCELEAGRTLRALVIDNPGPDLGMRSYIMNDTNTAWTPPGHRSVARQCHCRRRRRAGTWT